MALVYGPKINNHFQELQNTTDTVFLNFRHFQHRCDFFFDIKARGTVLMRNNFSHHSAITLDLSISTVSSSFLTFPTFPFYSSYGSLSSISSVRHTLSISQLGAYHPTQPCFL